ncbi:RHS repeat domain-containing protein [Pseudoduganella armeniaca]|uniref:RHS repeat-associated core domain-containing protein n=1 Tax=Pseudoduganella armeniaca TaxID=2072590 RepID=A0A2R4CAL5_9BURK|nr:RHS repeat-associated core domain-containing protein [Pseudoduganella armeniaca]AVR96635.1 hypothetical protein C9I28_13730 [Pseudoduganella armeniaca]
MTLQYNALGSVLYNSDVGIFTYPAKGAGKPHALQSVGGREPSSFLYDGNGNMVTSSGGKYRSIAYTSFNLPDSNQGVAGAAGGPQYRWMYDEAHQRIRENRIDASGTRVTWMMHPDAANGLSFEMEEAAGVTSNRHYLTAGGSVIGVLVSRGALPASPLAQLTPPELASVELVKLEYWHKDSLGSLVATTDHAGAVTGRYSYDPFGKRRTADGNYDANGNLVYDWNGTSGGTDRGYTGHEHLDDVGIIHMNGRLFDPRLGVFMQGDPYIQDPMNLQNYNRYAYCYNSPLTCTDPTGQLHLFGHRVLPGLLNSKNLRLVASIAAAYFLGPAGGLWAEGGALAGLGVQSVVAQSAIAGFASGAISTGSLKGALQGAFSGAIFAGAGNLASGGSFFTPATTGAVSWGTGVALHAVAGCISSEVGGGKCGSGALSAAFTKGVMSSGLVSGISEGSLGAVIVAATVGGTASVLGGDKFANGAMTGAFSYIFNDLAHNKLTGKEAEAARAMELEALGAKNIRSQVAIEALKADGTVVRAIADFVYEHDGRIVFEEVKAGLGARLTGNQVVVYDAIVKGEAMIVNSAVARAFNVEAGKPISAAGSWAMKLIAAPGGRAASQWTRYLAKGVVGAMAIVGSTTVMAADLYLHSSEAGRFSDCVASCTVSYRK